MKKKKDKKRRERKERQDREEQEHRDREARDAKRKEDEARAKERESRKRTRDERSPPHRRDASSSVEEPSRRRRRSRSDDGGSPVGSREGRRRWRIDEGFNSEEERDMEELYQQNKRKERDAEAARQREHDRRDERPSPRDSESGSERPPPRRRPRMDISESAARAEAVERSRETNTAPPGILYWFDNGDDNEVIPGQFKSLDEFSKTIEFINPSNGPIHGGLAITEEKSLDEASKLLVPDPADLSKMRGPLSILTEYGPDAGKQAVIALVVAHRMARALGIENKEFKDIPAGDRHKAFLVTSAYALCTYGLIGFYTKDEGMRNMDDKLTYCGGFISERDLNKDHESQTHDYVFTKDVACDVKVEKKQFWVDIIRGFTRTPDGKAVQMLYLDKYVTAELCSRALTLVAATKINWLQTNHHTGQGTPVHFIQKAASTIGQEFCDGGNVFDLCKAMHTAGHWASTHLMQIYTGVHIGLLPTSIHDPAKGITLTSDFKARAESMPAGTAPHSLIHASLKKFGHNMPITAHDFAEEMIDAGRLIDDILIKATESRRDKRVDDRLQLHMGAIFLIKKSRVTIGAPAPIGALGSYLYNCQKSSSLARSPLIYKIVDGKTIREYVNAEGFVEAYDNLCIALSRTVTANTSNAVEALRGKSVTGCMRKEVFEKLAALTVIPREKWGECYKEMQHAYEAIQAASKQAYQTGASSSST
jgi:hypothetical protein